MSGAGYVPARVLMTTDTVGGVWTYTMELAKALKPHGVQFTIAAMGGRLSPDQRAQAEALSNVDLLESEFRLEWMSDPWEDVARAGTWLLKLERQVQPEVVHLNGYVHGALPWSAPVLVVAHSCVVSWWHSVHRADPPPVWNLYRDTVAAGLQSAQFVVAPSRAMLAALARHYGPLPRTGVIHNGRKLNFESSALKEKLILSAGRIWDPAKNISALEQIASRLSWPVVIAGESTSPNGDCTKPSRLKLLGRLSEAALLPWFQRASIYALPARYEPFGLSVLEAALAGCALVLGDIPSLRELWEDAALFVDPNHPEVLEREVNRLIEDPVLLAELAQNARTRAQDYSLSRMAAGYLAAYAQLIETAEPATALETVMS